MTKDGVMNGKLRVGVIGTGGIAQMMHLPTLAERPDLFDVVALADLDAEVGAAMGKRYGVKHVETDAAKVIARDDVDAVLLLASGSQRATVERALAANKHVFIEKPLAIGRSDAEAIAALAKTKPELVVMVGYHKRYDPTVRTAKRFIDRIGDLRYVEVTVLHPDDGAYRAHHALVPGPSNAPKQTEAEDLAKVSQWVTNGPLAANLADIAGADASPARRVLALVTATSLIHDVNLVRGLIGEPERVVSSTLWRGGMAQSSVTRFAKGVRVAMSWIGVPGLKHYEERLRFVGPESRVTLTFPSPYLRHLPTDLEVERAEGEGLAIERHTVSYEEAFRVELHTFREDVLARRQPETSINDALGDARWIEQIVRNATEEKD